jgi:hypothetical protein
MIAPASSAGEQQLQSHLGDAGATQSIPGVCGGDANDDVWYSSQQLPLQPSRSRQPELQRRGGPRSGACDGTSIAVTISPHRRNETINAGQSKVPSTTSVKNDAGASVPATTTFTICVHGAARERRLPWRRRPGGEQQLYSDRATDGAAQSIPAYRTQRQHGLCGQRSVVRVHRHRYHHHHRGRRRSPGSTPWWTCAAVPATAPTSPVRMPP